MQALSNRVLFLLMIAVLPLFYSREGDRKNGRIYFGELTEKILIEAMMKSEQNEKVTKHQKFITCEEALDLVMRAEAVNFDRVSYEETENKKQRFVGEEKRKIADYYYQLAGHSLYLTYEDYEIDTGCYLIRLYEYIVDEEEEQLGHMYTYGFYRVDEKSGDIIVLK